MSDNPTIEKAPVAPKATSKEVVMPPAMKAAMAIEAAASADINSQRAIVSAKLEIPDGPVALRVLQLAVQKAEHASSRKAGRIWNVARRKGVKASIKSVTVDFAAKNLKTEVKFESGMTDAILAEVKK